MTALLASELLKVRTTRAPFWLVVSLVLMSALAAAGIVGVGALDDLSPALSLVDAAEISSVFATVLGILVVTNEYRHGTITPTLLVTPQRERVIVAKALAGAVVGLLAALAALVVVLAIAVPWLALRDEALPIDGDLAGAAARFLLVFVLSTLLGVALGTLIHSQVGAIVAVFVWFLVVEPIVGVLWGLLTDFDDGPVAPFLPGSALDSIVSVGDDVLALPEAIGLSLAYIVALFVAGAARTIRGDAD